jgi:hypothetical protein
LGESGKQHHRSRPEGHQRCVQESRVFRSPRDGTGRQCTETAGNGTVNGCACAVNDASDASDTSARAVERLARIKKSA